MFLEDAVKEFIFECQVRKYTWKTVKGYRNGLEFLVNYLKEEHGLTTIQQVQTRHLKEFFMYQSRRGRKESYLNGLIKTYRAFFKYVIGEEYITANPILKVSWMREPKSIIKTFSDDEVRRMLGAYPENDYMSMRNKAIIAMLFDTGIRNYELCTLTESQVKDSVIVIYGKGKKERQVGKSPYLAKILLKYERFKKYNFEYKNITVDNYFLSRTGRPLTDEAIENIVRNAGLYAQVSDSIRCSPHTCRHYFAQAQLKNGMDVYSLSRLLGHDNIKITQRYLQGLQDEDVVSRSIKTSVLMNL
ncbi:tyrosine-type recombinase/integrase [Acetanaerobacterium elongatum]|uniref:Integrase/recombinase XerD n=1 Tax=Acetanaerobacterium elongatum TaxID=258515 RepID=A0A1H0BNX7_9FIRM|nr:tyrosine-type recombinase/integrase [Acetanaerobacterium elongatum]SDN47213.1 integrase/recombinase XerD [Acetanaerobacterium elongatum]